MNQNIKGQVKATRRVAVRVTAIILAFAILCAGTAFAATSETSYVVDIYEGSQVTRIETTQTVAEKVVAEAGIQLSENDRLILDDFNPGKDSRIEIYRAGQVTFVHADGKTVDTTFAGTVEELIENQGVTLSDTLFSSVNVNAVVTNNLRVEIISAFDIIINVDGEEKAVQTTEKTVGDVLTEQGITLDEDDEVSPSADTVLSNDLVIDVLRVEYVTRETEEKIPFTTEKVNSSAMNKGTQKVTQKGVNGIKTFTYEDKVVNGVVESSELVKEEVTKEPVKEIIKVGTLVKQTSKKLGNNKIEKNGKPISELELPSKYTIGKNNVPTEYKYTIQGRGAAYCIPGGITATGRPVKPGYIAVNPKQIPYGTEMWIVSNDGVVYGYAIAADTGGFVKKGYFTCDLYMNSTEQCYQWGDRGVTIYVL
ncbi:MAG: DUF348 domain-containing protein [Clostridia bacterium]|nr:DUF348 domain-containing protein [Clostridia bacterium]